MGKIILPFTVLRRLECLKKQAKIHSIICQTTIFQI
nr:hypothetical protein [uncultured Haemophilus sp.]